MNTKNYTYKQFDYDLKEAVKKTNNNFNLMIALYTFLLILSFGIMIIGYVFNSGYFIIFGLMLFMSFNLLNNDLFNSFDSFDSLHHINKVESKVKGNNLNS